MNKSELKPLYVVKLRNGDIRIIIPLAGGGSYPVGTPALFEPGGVGCQQMHDAYTDDLRSVNDSSRDVMEVYGHALYSRDSLTTDCEGRKLLWSREAARKLTIKEIEVLLGFRIEVVGKK